MFILYVFDVACEVFLRMSTLIMSVACSSYNSTLINQSNDMVRDYQLNLSDSKLQNSATTTAHIYTLLARIFEKNK